MTSSRRCKGCIECCTALGVEELEKPEHTRCAHVGRGCRIYEERPESCRGFLCGWLQGMGAVADRPDRIGVVFDVQDGVHGRPILKAYVTRDTPRGRQRIEEAAQKMVVYEMRPGARRVHGPPDEVRAFLAARKG